MQLANIMVRLGGSLLNTVHVANASPAEIIVLRAIHGDDSVTDVRPTEFKPTRHDAEFERLATKYDRAASMAAPGAEKSPLLGRLFPGAIKKLPERLAEVGLPDLDEPEDGDDDDDDVAEKPKPRSRRAKKAEEAKAKEEAKAEEPASETEDAGEATGDIFAGADADAGADSGASE